MNGLELFLLGRRLIKIGEDAIPKSGSDPVPTSVRTIMIDIFENPDTSVGEITARTGFPQSHVSASVARLRARGVVLTAIDPADRRRTLVRASPDMPRKAAQRAVVPVDAAVATALATADPPGPADPEALGEVLAALQLLADRLTPNALGRIRAGMARA